MDILWAYLPEMIQKPFVLGPLLAILMAYAAAVTVRRIRRKEAQARREMMKRRLQV